MSKKETPVKKNDHLCDAARYLVMAKLGPTRKKLKSGFATIDELVTDDIQRARQPHKYKDHDEDFI